MLPPTAPPSAAAPSDTNPRQVRIALVGKYTGLQDSYLSVVKALQHAALFAGRKLVLDWVDASALEPGAEMRRRWCFSRKPIAFDKREGDRE